MQRIKLRTFFFSLLLSLSFLTHAAPGDILTSFSINNVTGDGRNPISPQGITYHNGYLYIVDFATDRIYRVYPADVYDEDETTILFSAGDSDFNIPLTDADNPPINSDGTPIPTCGSATPAGQYCGGGGLTFALNHLWNASPITDKIIKLDPVDGGNLESENTLAGLAFPSPTDMAYDGTHFWIVDWQTNTINKVLPEDGTVLATIPGPSSKPAYAVDMGAGTYNARPFGIAWDGQALWVSDQNEDMIYRVNPEDGSLLDFFSAPGSNAKGLTWDGEFLWHTDQATRTIYKLESGVIPFGIMGCLQKNGIPINGSVLLAQTAVSDQASTTNIDGCFVFPSFTAGTPLQVTVSETGVDQKPVISLNETTIGNTSVTLIVGQTYSEPGFTAMDAEDGNISANVIATPNVINNPSIINTSSPRTVTITYNVIDSKGNHADPVTRTVNVLLADTTPPVITLAGSSPLYIEQGTSYTEPGATAMDDRDGDLSANIMVTGTVNTNVAGSYSLNYNVSDSTGNAASTVTRTVVVQDTGAPTITLLGSSSMSIERGSNFVDPGATASDAIDGDLTSSITVSGNVGVNSTGSYVLAYNVSDSSGNAAPTVTRSVTVTDTAAPTITLLGSATINHELNTPFTDPGATAIDPPSLNITNDIVVTGSVNPNQIGTYQLTYNVTDSDGNAAPTVTRQVIVADTGAPSITLLGANPLLHEQGTAFSDPGATASDAVDGNLTASIVTTGTVNINTAGNYTLSYNVSDSQGNAAPTITRTVEVADRTAPTLNLIGDNPQVISLGDSYTESGATAVDNINGNITGSIVINASSVNTSQTGNYPVTYTVSDAAGNTANASRTVTVVNMGPASADSTPPSITLLGANPQTIERGSAYTELGATASDDTDGNLTASININSTAVNINTIGSYSVSYSVSDSAGNTTNAYRTVNVIAAADTTAPVITLLGSNPQTITAGNTYIELGASATDNVDGNISGNIVINASAVNTNAPGNYSVTYNVSDSSGNNATQIVRSVNVVAAPDTTAPVITLTGANPQVLTVGTAYNELGATASDNIDGNISANIVINTSSLNTNAIGNYTVSYSVSDSAGNTATANRSVNVVAAADTTPPSINILGVNPQTILQGSAYVELGASATDNIDGDLTSNIVINSSSLNTSVIGSYTVTYNVTDSAGNNAPTVTRTVNVVSATSTYTSNPGLAVGAASVSSTLNIPNNIQIADMNIYINMNHTYVGDISVTLTSPAGTAVTLIDRPGYSGSGWGCNGQNFDVTLDDQAGSLVESACNGTPPAISGNLRPNNLLNAFNGESSLGTWTLRVNDAYTAADTGTLNTWQLIITQ